MMTFFLEGGWGMIPVLVTGLILVWSAIRFALDREAARRPFISALSVAHLVLIAQAVVSDVAMVCWALTDETRVPADRRVPTMLEGLKESSRPALLGFGLLAVALLAVSVGVYRTSQRELRALRG